MHFLDGSIIASSITATRLQYKYYLFLPRLPFIYHLYIYNKYNNSNIHSLVTLPKIDVRPTTEVCWTSWLYVWFSLFQSICQPKIIKHVNTPFHHLWSKLKNGSKICPRTFCSNIDLTVTSIVSSLYTCLLWGFGYLFQYNEATNCQE